MVAAVFTGNNELKLEEEFVVVDSADDEAGAVVPEELVDARVVVVEAVGDGPKPLFAVPARFAMAREMMGRAPEWLAAYVDISEES